jgi:DHA3 family macrolide efflux protein-like MFS transporter
MTENQSSPHSMRTFIIIWIGQVISQIGSGLTGFALAVWIFEQTRQATPFAFTVLLSTVPRLVLSPWAGSLADRRNRRRIMLLADTGNALVTLAVVGLLFAGRLEIWHVFVIAALGAVFGAFQEPAFTSSIVMLVPKKDLARAGGLSQLGQALELIVAPVLAGALFVTIGLRGIVLVDFATYFFAVGALLLVRIPQPKRGPEAAEGQRPSVRSDTAFGWRYLRQRSGLFGLLLYFALVNFLLNFAAVLTGPLLLARHTAAALGTVQMASGLGMLAGSIAMSAWGGPRRRINAVIGFIGLAGVGLLITGVRPEAVFAGAGLFLLLFSVPFASSASQAIFQTKVAPEVQGRVFAMRSMISRSMTPLAFALAGPLADRVFEPLMQAGGALAASPLGTLLGVGAGRGVGLMFVTAGVVLLAATGLAFLNPRIRHVERELPDAVVRAEPEPGAVAVESGQAAAAAAG